MTAKQKTVKENSNATAPAILPPRASVNWYVSNARLMLDLNSSDSDKNGRSMEVLSQMKDRIEQTKKVYDERLAKKKNWNEGKETLTGNYDKITKEIEARLNIEESTYNFFKSKQQYFSSVQVFMHDFIESTNEFYESRIKTVGYISRFKIAQTKVNKLLGKLKIDPSQIPKLPLTLTAGIFGVVAAYYNMTNDIVVPLQEAARKVQDPGWQASLSAMVKPVIDIVNFFVLVGISYWYRISNQNRIRKLKDERTADHARLLEFETKIRSLLHQRMALQVCKIMLDEGQKADVKAYNSLYAKMYDEVNVHGKRAWDKFYNEKAGKIDRELQGAFAGTKKLKIWQSFPEEKKQAIESTISGTIDETHV